VPSSLSTPQVRHAVCEVAAARADLGLLDRLAQVPDPRSPQGRWHPLVSVLALGVCERRVGNDSFTAIGEWVAQAPQPLLASSGYGCKR